LRSRPVPSIGGAEHRVVPVFIAQELRDRVPPARFALHGRVPHQLVRNVKAIRTADRIIARVELGGICLGKQDRAVGQWFSGLGCRERRWVRIIVADLPRGRKIDGVIFAEGFLVILWKRHLGRSDVRQQSRLAARRRPGLRGKISGNVGNLLETELGGNCIHDGGPAGQARLFAGAVLEELELRLEIGRALCRKVGNSIAYADTRCAVACGAYHSRYPLPRLDIRGLCRLSDGQNDGKLHQYFH